MDEKSESVNCPWPVEEIPVEAFLYRQVHFGHLKMPKPRRFPNEAAFALKENEDGLSVYWDKYINIKNIFLTIGLSFKATGGFKNHSDFKIFKFKKEFLLSVEGISDVKHSPAFNGDPSPVGEPNIRAHSIVIYDNNDDTQVRVVLSDHCTNNYSDCYCEFKMEVNTLLAELRDRLNDTEFHRA